MKGEVKWSPTRIDAANYCRMRYWLKYLDPNKEPPARLSAYAKGSFLHNLTEKFWDKLGTPEEVSKNPKKKKYYDAESFSKHAQGKWMSIIIGSKNSSKPLEWRSKDEPYEIKGSLPKICKPLFENFMKEGRPLFTELPFDFRAKGVRFSGRIDEIRVQEGEVIIRDYKSGKPWVGEMKLRHDPQLTIYNVALSSMSRFDSKLAEMLGVGDERKRFLGNPDYVNPDFVQEFFMFEAPAVNREKVKTIPEMINKASRRNEHFYEVLKMIEGIEKAMMDGDVYPERGRKCDTCDMNVACEARLDDAAKGELVSEGQLYFDFVTPLFIRKPVADWLLPDAEVEQPKMRFRYKERKKAEAKGKISKTKTTPTKEGAP